MKVRCSNPLFTRSAHHDFGLHFDLRGLGFTLEEARDAVTLRRATHDISGVYRRDWTRADIPIDDARLQALQVKLRTVHDAYERQADNLARFDRWLTKRFTGGQLPQAPDEDIQDDPLT